LDNLIKLNFILIIFLALQTTLFSQVIQNITVEGERELAESDYKSWSKISAGTKVFPFLTDSAEKRISSELSKYGYYNSKIFASLIASSDSGKVNLSIVINENQPTIIKSINVVGNSQSDSILVSENFKRLNNRTFLKDDVEESINNLLDYYENNGHPFIKIKINSVFFSYDSTLETHFADIYMEIDTGRIAKIDQVEILGNTKTKDFVVTRDTRLEKGELYSQQRIDEIPSKLNKLKFFDPVEVPSFYFNSKDEGVLLINVKERETNNFDGIIGYVPGGKTNDKGYVTGMVNISLRNMFGTGRASAFKWQRIDRYSQELELKYLEPWLFGFPFNLNASFNQLKQDTSYVQRKFEGWLEFLATENISAAVTFATEAVIPTISDYSIFTVYNSSLISTGFNIKIDTRDDVYYPTEGIYFLNTYTFTRKSINGPADYITENTQLKTNLQRFAIDFLTYFNVINNQVVSVGLHGKELRSSLIEISDLYKFGGTNTLRGFRENQFLANRLLWSNLEYRFLLGKRTYTFLFFDSGYYLRNADEANSILRTSEVKLSYGGGISLETGLGILSVSYALAKGDTFNEGKIHFGIINEF